jgi:hypothetical protein
MLSANMPSVMLSVVMLCVIIPSIVVLNVINLSVLVLNVINLSVLVLNCDECHFLSTVVLSIFLYSVSFGLMLIVMLCCYAECQYVECYCAECFVS